MSTLDKRLNAFRDDLADERLKGKVGAARLVQGKTAFVSVPVADIVDKPLAEAGLQTQCNRGEEITVFEDRDGWSWLQRKRDGYVGYMRSDQVSNAMEQSTHIVLAPRTFVYSGTDLQFPRVETLSMGAQICVTGSETKRGTDYLVLSNGHAVIAHHVMAIGDWKNDPVSLAETLLHTPYLWGGDTGFGIDCSGIVQLTHQLCGRTVLRDSDMQFRSIGTALEGDKPQLQRGDLVFWKGHVAMMVDAENMIHANGHTMTVAIENFEQAVARIGYLYGQPTGFRRPDAF